MDELKQKIIAAVLRREKAQTELFIADKELDTLLALDKKSVQKVEFSSLSVSSQNTQTKNEVRQPLAKGDFVSGSIPDQIMQILNAQPGRVFTASELIDDTCGRSNQNVRNSLARMMKHGQVKKLEHGRYQAAPKEKK